MLRMSSPNKKPIVALFKKNGENGGSILIQGSNGNGNQFQGNQKQVPNLINQQNQQILAKSQINFFEIQTKEKPPGFNQQQQQQPRLGTSHSQKNMIRQGQQMNGNMLAFSGSTVNLNGVNNFGLIGNLGNQIQMSSAGSAGLIYNAGLKQKLGGTQIITPHSQQKNSKIKAEFFKSQMKQQLIQGSGISSQTINNNTASVQQDTQQDSDGANPSMQIGGGGSASNGGHGHPRDLPGNGGINPGFWTQNGNNYKNEINNPLYFIFNNIVQIQPSQSIQQPQFISGIFGSSIGGNSTGTSHGNYNSNKNLNAQLQHGLHRVFSQQDLASQPLLPQQQRQGSYPIQQRIVLKQQQIKKHLMSTKGANKYNSQRPQTRGQDTGGTQTFAPGSPIKIFSQSTSANQNENEFNPRLQNANGNIQNHQNLQLMQQRQKPSTGYGSRAANRQINQNLIQATQGANNLLMSSPLTNKNVGNEMNQVNGLLKKGRENTKGTGSKISVEENNYDNNEGIDNNNNNEDDDELLSSIHSIQQNNTNEKQVPKPQGYQTMRQFQFLRNDREEETCFNDLYSTLFSSLE
ncbi:UNKNOWN [Stylonychia lemnae]|uniref:Uncharacterized protein n=1 Tax=Stylonychia lemnae TaxID=5949 RepID=A0A078AVV4_STYLE|nr:UNKNOWN [Stylonychia lemnae]|eukprot:CDW86565.1 UNKNOWN [Stylonychia lemnae]